MYIHEPARTEFYYKHCPGFITQLVDLAPSKMRMCRIAMALTMCVLLQYGANAYIEMMGKRPSNNLSGGRSSAMPQKRTPSESIWIVTPTKTFGSEPINWIMEEDLETLKTEPTRLGVLTHIFLLNPLLLIAMGLYKIFSYLFGDLLVDPEEPMVLRRWVVDEYATEERIQEEKRKKYGDRSVVEYLEELRKQGKTLEDVLNPRYEPRTQEK